MTNRDDDKEVQELLRNVAAVVLLILFVCIVLVSLVAPFMGRDLDSTLILGLSASIIGAIPVLLGVQIALSRKKDD